MGRILLLIMTTQQTERDLKMFDLITSNKMDATELSSEELRNLVPAAYAEHAAPEVSSRYGFVQSSQAIDILRQHNFHPIRAAQKPTRGKIGNELFNEHMITFAQNGLHNSEGERAELILYNSNNGRSSLKLFAGCYRMICSNGIISGDGFGSKLRHSKLTANGFSDLVEEQANNLPNLLDKIDAMKGRAVSDEKALEFAFNAVKLRWEIDPNEQLAMRTRQNITFGSYANTATAQHVGRQLRYHDQGNDQWTTFNRVQEGIQRGRMVQLISYTKKRPFGMRRKARAITGLKETVRVNRQLWDLAHAMA